MTRSWRGKKKFEEIEKKCRRDEILQRLEQIERDKVKNTEEQAKQEKIQTTKQMSELNAAVVKLYSRC